MKRIRAYLMLAFGALLLLGFVGDTHGNVRYRSQFGCDAFNRPTSITNANGLVTQVFYDILGRPMQLTYPGGVGSESFQYSSTGLLSHLDVTGFGKGFGYDAAGRLKTISYTNNAVARTVTMLKDPSGIVTNLTDPLSHVTRWLYDQYGRATNKFDAQRELYRWAYDVNGLLTNRWSAANGGKAISYSYDAVGNLKTILPSSGSAIAIDYDALNRPNYIVDGIGTNRLAYTPFGSLASEDGPWEQDTVAYGYQTNHNLGSLSLQMPGGSWQQYYGYDTANRLTNIVSAAGSFGYSYTSIAGQNFLGTLLKKIALPNGCNITNLFDTAGRLYSTQLGAASTLGSHGYAFVNGRVGSQTNYDNSTLTYAYDNIGQLTSAIGKESGGTPRLNQQLGYTYDGGGNLLRRTNNALVTTLTPDTVNQISTLGQSGTLTVAGTTASTASSVTVSANGGGASAATLYGDKTFALTNVGILNGANTFTAVASDSAGRLDTNTVSVNLPSSASFSYDYNGNLTGDGQRTFGYDAFDQLTSITVAGSWQAQFQYDAMGRRRIKREYTYQNGQFGLTSEVRYVYDGMLAIQERDGFNTPRVTYTRGMDLSGGLQGAGGIGGLLARSEMSAYGDASHAYYHSDALGNVTTLVDANQRIAARYLYDPFGNTLSAIGPLAQANTYQFSSKERHANSGFYYYGLRFYDPATQRFLNRDPIEEWGGMNLYGFVGNNPMGAVDAFGLIAGIADDTDEELDQRLANLSMPGRGGLLGATHGYNKPMRDWNNKHWDDSMDTLKCAAKDAAKEAAKLGLMLAATEGLGMVADAGLALRNSSRLANAATSGTRLAEEMGVLREAARSSGNYGLGSATSADAMRLGKAWVGDGYKVASDGKTLLSADGLRQFRPPTPKSSSFASTGVQANFERRAIPSGTWGGNGHLNIIP